MGAGAATAVSLFAVSALGEGMIPTVSQQLSVGAVNRALSGETVERPASPSGPSIPRASSPVLHRVPSPSPTATGGTLLTSRGGTVVAACTGGSAYLMSWSPGQGFEAARVIRGPAATVQATFTGVQLTVTMVVSCAGGVPTATSSVTGGLPADE
jgi:hypothetical protein